MLKANQIHCQMLAEKYKALKIDHNELAASRRSAKKSSVRTAKELLAGESKEISLAGGRFSVVGELWVDETTLETPVSHDTDPLNPSRYADPGSEARSTVAELYLDLKPHLRPALVDDNRRSTFVKLVSF